MDCRKKTNLEICNCSFVSCSRRGLCCECIDYHRAHDELPACYFSDRDERTYNRSIDFFISKRGK